jgi:hypothetical protein
LVILFQLYGDARTCQRQICSVKQFRDTVRMMKTLFARIITFFVQYASLDFQVHLKYCRLPWDLLFFTDVLLKDKVFCNIRNEEKIYICVLIEAIE